MTDPRGFSLIEVMVATAILVVGVVSVAQLLTVGMRSNLTSRAATETMILAQQKIEELRALTWGFDALGNPVSDTSSDTAVSPEQPAGGTGLGLSPAGALIGNVAGYVDYIDRAGAKLGGGTSVPAGTIYTRRWSVAASAGAPEALVIQVLVTRTPNRGATNRLPEEARLVTVKTRKPA